LVLVRLARFEHFPGSTGARSVGQGVPERGLIDPMSKVVGCDDRPQWDTAWRAGAHAIERAAAGKWSLPTAVDLDPRRASANHLMIAPDSVDDQTRALLEKREEMTPAHPNVDVRGSQLGGMDGLLGALRR